MFRPSTTEAIQQDRRPLLKRRGKRRGVPSRSVVTYPLDFEPKHCAGEGCVHNHRGETRRLGTVQGWRA